MSFPADWRKKLPDLVWVFMVYVELDRGDDTERGEDCVSASLCVFRESTLRFDFAFETASRSATCCLWVFGL